jgi:hypothetical protein
MLDEARALHRGRTFRGFHTGEEMTLDHSTVLMKLNNREGSAMRLKTLSILILSIAVFTSCKKNESSPTAAPTYTMSDLQGTWKGDAINSSNTLNLTLVVDSQCKVSGSGVSCTWAIDETGKVSGSGSFAFTSGHYLTVAASSWSLQMNTDKKTMTGTMDVAYPTLHSMSTTLTKQ